MTTDRGILYWSTNKDWYTFDEENGYQLTDEAPEEAKKAFEEWEAQLDI